MVLGSNGQNGCEGVLGTCPPLLSRLAKSDQGFQVYIYARCALLCCRRICKFTTCGLKSPFLCLYPKFQTCPFSSLGCTVLHWRNQQGGNQQISCGHRAGGNGTAGTAMAVPVFGGEKMASLGF